MKAALLGLGGLVAAVGVGAGIYAATQDGGEEEVLQNPESASATSSPSNTPAATDATPATVEPTTSPSIPADWAVYTDESAGFSFRYPAEWFAVDNGGVYSWDVNSSQTRPPDGITVQVLSGPVDQSEQRPSDATDTTLAGLPAWEYVRTEGPDMSADVAKAHIIAADSSGMRFFLVAAFGPANIDEKTFALIASSFQFVTAAQ